MTPACLLVLASIVIPTADEKDDAAKKELTMLQGTWVMEYFERDGKKTAEQDVTTDARRELTIRDNKFTEGQVKGEKSEGFLRVDAQKKPKAMDRSPTNDFKPSETSYSIYELDGDKLKTCFVSFASKEVNKPEKRPTEFKTAPDVVIVYWKRMN